MEIEKQEAEILSDEPEHQMLACEIPQDIYPGSIFHVVAPDGKFYEVTAPTDSKPGDTINILIPVLIVTQEKTDIGVQTNQSTSQTIFQSLSAGIESIAKQIDDKYQISAKVTEFDQKHEISSRTSQFLQKAKEFNDSHHVKEKITEAGDMLVGYAREVDERYAISATTAWAVETSSEAFSAALARLRQLHEEHKVSERTTQALQDFQERTKTRLKELEEEARPVIQATTTRITSSLQEGGENLVNRLSQLTGVDLTFGKSSGGGGGGVDGKADAEGKGEGETEEHGQRSGEELVAQTGELSSPTEFPPIPPPSDYSVSSDSSLSSDSSSLPALSQPTHVVELQELDESPLPTSLSSSPSSEQPSSENTL